MTYVALLRGINVGGNHRVEMKRLKILCEQLGLTNVATYINSGNVIFDDNQHSSAQLSSRLEKAIAATFGFPVKVLIRDLPAIKSTTQALPNNWVNDQTMKCDVLFLSAEIDHPSILDQFKLRPEFEELKYVPGALLWRIDRPHISKSALLKLVGTPLYKQMTIRNCNTLRKLEQLMQKDR